MFVCGVVWMQSKAREMTARGNCDYVSVSVGDRRVGGVDNM